MRIDRLTVRNFKGFSERAFEFDPTFNLLVGANGSGKTSALQTVALALELTLQHFGEFATPWPLRNVFHRKRGSNGQVRFEPEFPVELDGTGVIDRYSIEFYARVLSQTDLVGWSSAAFSADRNSLFRAIQKIKIEPASIWPLLAFYPANRSQASAGEPVMQWNKVMTSKAQRLDGYTDCLSASASADSFMAWLARQQLIGLQQGQPTSLFKCVGQAVCQCLPDATALSFDVQEAQPVVEMTDGLSVRFHDLSDGQRSLLAMVADMAIRAAQLNDHLGDSILTDTPGVVLIDELDLHLHPRWQRRVVADLRRVFPKVQFITTTHSPQIIGETSPEQIIVLTSTGNKRVSQAFGLDSNAVLEDVMGASSRNEEIERGLAEVYRLIDADDLAAAKEKIAGLQVRQHGTTAPLASVQALVDQIEMLADEIQASAK